MTPECRATLQQLSDSTASDAHVASISWGLIVDGRLAEHGHTGDLHDELPADDTAVYRIASMTKSFTAAIVLRLRDQGIWQLDDPIARHAPELASVVGPPGSAPVTIRQLLSMTSGLATDDAWADRHLDLTADEIDVIYAAGPTFAHAPNTAYEYSNLGYGMLGRGVLRATGKRVQDHITDELLQPLEMHDSTWVRPDHDHWARPHRWQDGHIVRDWPTPIGDGEIAPMGGLWTTVSDLAKWVAWFDDDTTDISLSMASRHEMQRIHTFIGTTTVAGRTCPAGYGFGVNLRIDPDLGTIVSHAGGLPGYGSSMRWLKGKRLGVVALGNSTYAHMSTLTMQMLEALLDDGAVPTITTPLSPQFSAAADGLVALLNSWSDDAATSLFSDNVVLDEPFSRQRAAAVRLLEQHGQLRITEIRPTAAASGTIVVQGTGASFTIDIELSPVAGGAIQLYEIH
ncbi:MAG TPA: serine hydrolase domain-containing protein [Ilumatobacteraceae bacterium]|nr:serine hydrolase domain-containing protein [Ilumatobacteraceae bacterium]